MANRAETDLYIPVKLFLETQGFCVRGEVNGCDLVAIKGEDILIVELKPSFNLDLVFQGIDRQSICDNVYLAVEAKPFGKGREVGQRQRWRDIIRLCRRLELGLLSVRFSGGEMTGGEPVVKVEAQPDPAQRRKSKAKRVRLIAEVIGRSRDYNTGGSVRRPLVTAYRERALKVLTYLENAGSAKPAQVKQAIGIKDVYAILSRNVYGWFTRVEKAVYSVTPEGRQALVEYSDVVSNLSEP